MRRAGFIGLVVLVIDLLAVLLGLMSAHAAWKVWRATQGLEPPVAWWQLFWVNDYMPSALVLTVAWIVVVRQVGLYDPFQMTNSLRIAAGVSRASLVLLVMAMSLQFLMPEMTYSRSLLLAFCGFSSLYLGVLRLTFFRVQSHLPRSLPKRRVAIVGRGRQAMDLEARITRAAGSHYEVIGFLRPSQDPEPTSVEGDRMLGSVSEIGDLVNTYDLRSLVLPSNVLSREEALILATHADKMGLHVYQVPFSWGVAAPRVDLANLGDLQLIDLTGLEYPTLAEQTKRFVDVVLVGVGGLLLLPWLTLVALAIKLQDGGPVLFVQERCGRGGRKFPFYKFRSMVVGAEEQRAALDPHNEADGVLFKVANDPRITSLGRFMRKFSIDELPQLLNVLRGEMNLVGPRPLPMADLEGIEHDPEMSYWFELRHKVKPGITGPWQVAGRSNLGMKEMIQHDIFYIQNWSLWLDLVILLKTIPAVLRGRGAR